MSTGRREAEEQKEFLSKQRQQQKKQETQEKQEQLTQQEKIEKKREPESVKVTSPEQKRALEETRKTSKTRLIETKKKAAGIATGPSKMFKSEPTKPPRRLERKYLIDLSVPIKNKIITAFVQLSKAQKNFHEKSNFRNVKYDPDKEAYYALTGASRRKDEPLPTLEEAINRLGFLATSITKGGLREATLQYDVLLPESPEEFAGEFVGAIITPTPLDFVMSKFISEAAEMKRGHNILDELKKHLTKSGKEKQSLLDFLENIEFPESENIKALRAGQKKIVDLRMGEIPEYFPTKKELEQFEKIVGKSGVSTSDLRNYSIDELRAWAKVHGVDNIDDAIEAAKKESAYIDMITETGKFDEITNRLSKMRQQELIEAIQKQLTDKNYIYKIDEEGYLTNFGKLTEEQRKKIVDNWKKLMSYWEENPVYYTAGAARSKPLNAVDFNDYIIERGFDDIDDYIDFMARNPKKIRPDVAVALVEYLNLSSGDKAGRDAKEGIYLARPLIDEIDDTGETVGIDDIIDVGETTEEEEIIEQQLEETTKEPPPEETQEPPPEETQPIKLSIKDKEKRRKINLRLYNGPKEKYSVRYGDGETVKNIEARSLIDALAKAQRSRKGKKTVNLIEVMRVR